MPARLHAVVIGANAFLLFLVQPLIGKALLPWLGGASATWTVCLLFFQAMLLAGYLVAHLLATRLGARAQGFVQLALIAASLAALPIAPDPALAPDPAVEPAWPLLRLLATSVGLPYLVLATTGPLVQRWFAADHPSRLPWPLFAFSNAAALAALVAYPLLVEPTTRLGVQLAAWGWAYALACVPFAWLAAGRLAKRDAPALAPATPASAPRVMLWLALAAAGSALLMTTTARITHNVAPVPLLWMAPLVLYLLSFVLAFAGPRFYPRGFVLSLAPIALAGLAALPSFELSRAPIERFIAGYLAAAFVAFWAAHGELARARPATGDLTRYYLAIAAGGALGGLAIALVAPRVFDTEPDFALAVFALALAVSAALLPEWRAKRDLWTRALGGAVLIGLAFLAFTLWRGREQGLGQTLATARNFYGVLRVEVSGVAGDPEQRLRLVNGRILHGEQFVAPERRRWGTTYYGPASGAALAIFATRRDPAPQRVGVVGLGVGTLATWGRARDVYRFYEINPLVNRLAETRFTFLADSPARIEHVPGDARLAMAREAPQAYDALAIDAFTGDSIPVHLLTEEAFALYFRHLAPHGILAVHVSNRYLELGPVVAAAAARAGRVARMVDSPPSPGIGAGAASWVVVAAEADALAFGVFADRTGEIEIPAGLRPWTDDYSSLLAVLGRRRGGG